MTETATAKSVCSRMPTTDHRSPGPGSQSGASSSASSSCCRIRKIRRKRCSYDDDDSVGACKDSPRAPDRTLNVADGVGGVRDSGLITEYHQSVEALLMRPANTEGDDRPDATTRRSSTWIGWRIMGFVTMALMLLQLFGAVPITNALRKGSLLIPAAYNAGSGDMHVQLHYDPRTLDTANPADPTAASSAIRLQVSRLDAERGRQTIAILDAYADPRSNVTQVTVPCQCLLLGGAYEFEIVGSNEVLLSTASEPATTDGPGDERLRRQLDIRWPVPKLSVTPESVGTYPEGPVEVILEFPGVECALRTEDVEHVPEFWLELFYCGHEVYCDSANVSASQVLYSEQVRGYPRLARIVKLSCELFGLAGHYVVKLRPTGQVLASVSATAYVKADWSEQFVFNVHARSITPCDPHTGIGVLFEYPACILDRADRVRLFAKLRADVASLAPPTTLHYVTEQRVVRGQHSLHFDCELFSEKYIEYCFVYVSQAISGAVADIRMDCLPTLPVSDADVGGWGPWSDWTPCSTTCAGGTKNRYRVCDSPPPRYGAKFCQGDAVETRQCGGPVSGTWECMYGNSGYGGGPARPGAGGLIGELPADRPEVRAEIGPACRCGCIVHLSVAKARRMIASSAESCPGRTFWLIQADAGRRIQFSMDFFRLACATQYVRIRDGDSRFSELIAEYVGGSGSAIGGLGGGRLAASATAADEQRKLVVMAPRSQILLEFYTNDLSVLGDECKGGFLVYVQQTAQPSPNATISMTSRAVMAALDVRPAFASRLSIVHIAAILFAGFIVLVSALLGIQYVFRYRKYQLAESQGEPDSPAHTPRSSIDGSAAEFGAGGSTDGTLGGLAAGGVARATSTTTLLSEVQSLIKMRPRLVGGGGGHKHQRLRESVDAEALAHAADGGQATVVMVVAGAASGANGDRSSAANDDDSDAPDREDDDDNGGQGDAENASIVSSHTLTNETTNSSVGGRRNSRDAPKHLRHQHHHLPVVNSMSTSATTAIVTDDDTVMSDAEPVSPNTLGSCSPDDADESSPTSSCSPPRPKSAHHLSALHQHHHSVSSLPASSATAAAAAAATLADARRLAEVPAMAVASVAKAQMTPRKWQRDKRLAAAARRTGEAEMRARKLSISSAVMLGSRDGVGSSAASVAMGSPNLTDTEGSSLLRTRRLKKLHGRCYSPASSNGQLTVNGGGSTAASSTTTLRTSAAKDSKEKQNRQKLLAGPGSEFSLANPEDFELDYYDYNVINAGAAPGSYLGMDPAYLVWIPPLDGGDIIQEMDQDAEMADALDGRASDERLVAPPSGDSDEEPHYEEIRLPGAQTERSIHSIETASPQGDAPQLPPLNGSAGSCGTSDAMQSQYARQMEQKNQRNSAISKVMAATALSAASASAGDLIPMKELRSGANKCGQHSGMPVRQLSEEQQEKETAVLKSPEPPRCRLGIVAAAGSGSCAAGGGATELDDIQFADDEDDDETGCRYEDGQVVFADNRGGTIRANAYYQPAPVASTSSSSYAAADAVRNVMK